MRDSIRNEIAEFASIVKLIDPPELNTADDWDALLKNFNGEESLITAAFAALLHVVNASSSGSSSDILDRMEKVIDATSNLLSKHDTTHSIAYMLIHIAYIWDAKDLNSAKEHAKKIVAFIAHEICNTSEHNLFLKIRPFKFLNSKMDREQTRIRDAIQKHNRITVEDPFDYDSLVAHSVFLRLLKVALSISFRILDAETTNIFKMALKLEEIDNESFPLIISHSKPIQKYACSTAEYLWQIDAYEPAAVLYEVAMNTTCTYERLDTVELLDAYNVWGLCKIETNALDSAFSIFERGIKIYKTAVHNSISIFPNLHKYAARIFANMAYICGTYANDAIDGSKEEKKHLLRARTLINNSLELDPNNAATQCSSAALHYFCNEYGKALQQYSAYYNTTSNHLEKLSAMGNCIEIRLELLCQCDNSDCYNTSTEYNDIASILLENLKEYKELYTRVKDSHYSKRQEYYQEIEKARTIIDNFNLGQLGNNCNQISMCLLQIYMTAQKIKANLQYDLIMPKKKARRSKSDSSKQRNEELPIAYYTTIENVKFLLDKTDVISDGVSSKHSPPASDLWLDSKSNKSDQKNCLTMMHVCYMNDPTEGYTLLQALSDSISAVGVKNYLFQDTTPSVFREKLLDEKFVFLKSFTSLIDQLNMWTMYASDRSDNSDSNGCCVCIAPESFHMMLNAPQKSNDNKQLARNLDDFHLYRVAYVQNGKLCDSDPKLNEHYNNLNKLIIRLNNLLLNYQSQIDNSSIWAGLSQSLSFVAFLFKDASYSAEKELRLIITRDKTNKQQIKMTSQTPPKLFITPPHQIFAESIILGPKLLAQDKWIPYLQYKLVDMWETWPEAKYGPRVPKVRKSSISYRD